MKKLESLKDFLVLELRDLYDAEMQLTKALPKMVKHASLPQLQDAFESHLEETKDQVVRLEKVFHLLESRAIAKTCEAMKGLIREAEEAFKETASPEIKDVLLIACAQKVEHYEIASYGILKSLAKRLQLSEVFKLLDETIHEEKDADDKLTMIAESDLYAQIRNEKSSIKKSA